MVNRDPKFTNFVEVSDVFDVLTWVKVYRYPFRDFSGELVNDFLLLDFDLRCLVDIFICHCGNAVLVLSFDLQFRTHKVIYRRYAGLFFSLCVDITDNELAYLECIHLFVEILDHFFSNVCELDLVFNFHKV